MERGPLHEVIMKATITIQDTPNGKCEVEIHFDPPLPKSGPDTPAGELALFVLGQIKKNASSFKQTMHLSRSK